MGGGSGGKPSTLQKAGLFVQNGRKESGNKERNRRCRRGSRESVEAR